MQAQRRADPDRRPLDRRDERLVEPRQRADELAARPRRARPRFARGSRRGNRRCRCRRRTRRRRPSPAPRRCPSSALARGSASRRARYIAPVSAFFFSGRFSVATSTPPSRFDIDGHATSLQRGLRAGERVGAGHDRFRRAPAPPVSSFSAKKRASATRPASPPASPALARQAPPSASPNSRR